MGTWGMGPFQNDTAADFSQTLDETDASEREAVVRQVLRAAVRTQEHLEEAIAAARLIAARQPAGEPVDDVFGPKEPMPAFPDDVRVLAVEALDRVVAEGSYIAELWDESGEGQRWRRSITNLRSVLDPQPWHGTEPLFEI
ncbi:DUF4259 domain-containing protein [Embleya sp. NPDC127516]|uniref:DUF4259 domain-containing protein n=1 Tax=Embleya sp. NPDC127516 TaxID=3363990 RepID=UPI00380A2B92